MFVRDGALSYYSVTPDGRLRCTWGRRTRSGEHCDRCGRVVRSSAVTVARTAEALVWGRIAFFWLVRRDDGTRHVTR